MAESLQRQRFDLTREAQDDGGYDSTNEDDEYSRASKKARHDLASKGKKDARRHAKGSKEVFRAECAMEEGRKLRNNLLSLSAYDRHKQLVNTYQLYYKGSTSTLERDKSNDKRDIDVIRDHHKFLWDEGEEGDGSWEVQLARKYYDKLFKEYCIIDLSRYKDNQFGMRWRTEKEVVLGKGQFVCACKRCENVKKLRTWEVNFGYIEHGAKKNALVKCRLCFECSYKLNYHHKKKDVTRKKKKKRHRSKRSKKKKRRKDDSRSSSDDDDSSSSSSSSSDGEAAAAAKKTSTTTDEAEASAASIWSKPAEREEEKSRDEVFNDFLEDLFL